MPECAVHVCARVRVCVCVCVLKPVTVAPAACE